MKVLVLSQYYPPEPVPLPRAVAQGLATAGHEVRVLTGFPNYPSGELYSGFSQRWRDREQDGRVDVMRVPLMADHSANAVKRMMNYGSFALSSASARSFARGADVIYVYATQMSAALGPWLWSYLPKSTPYVTHVQDLWPDSIVGSTITGDGATARVVATVLNPWLGSVYRRAAGVVGIAPTMVDTLIARGSDAAKTHLVYNWADEAAVTGQQVSDSASTTLLYAGNVGDMQDLETVVEAVHRARDSGVRLVIAGNGVALPRVRALVEELRSTNIEFLGRVPSDAMPELYSTADYALVTLKDLPAFGGTVPSKLQAALAHGVPVITTVQGDVRGIVERSGTGFTAEPESVTSLEAALRRAASSDSPSRAAMGQRARQTYHSQFSARAGIESIERILVDAAAHHTKETTK